MQQIIARYDIVLFITLGAIAIFLLRLIWLARANRSYSIFSLERESATSDMLLAIVGLMFVLALMVGVYFVSRITPPQVTVEPTSTPTSKPTATAIVLLPTPTPPFYHHPRLCRHPAPPRYLRLLQHPQLLRFPPRQRW